MKEDGFDAAVDYVRLAKAVDVHILWFRIKLSEDDKIFVDNNNSRENLSLFSWNHIRVFRRNKRKDLFSIIQTQVGLVVAERVLF
jgi:hypothetical protein